VIPESELTNTQKVADLIAENRRVSIQMRSQIRDWVRAHWDWGILVDKYIKNLRSMRIVLIGPGAMSIPPRGWGACESLIWDYAETFRAMGHNVLIVNTQNADEIVRQTNEFAPDIVHLQYDEHYAVMNRITCRAKVATSHYAYLEHPTFNGNLGYRTIFHGYINGPFVIASLSEGIKQAYVRAGCSYNKIYVAPNGANDKAFRYTDTPAHFDRSIYIGKIEERKKQYVYQNIQSLYFAGNTICSKFDTSSPRYLGEWTKQTLYDSLTDYGNLVLLSDGEAHPLVVCEALVCGLGVVVSRVAAANLDLSKPFITVIPDEKLGDIEYVTKAIEENRTVSVASRKEIREYALKNFTWSVRAEHLYQLYRMMTGL
jgi:glycosyltransferase involved in cell wall biosynthesis